MYMICKRMLDIDLKTPLTCHERCVGGIIGNAPVI